MSTFHYIIVFQERLLDDIIDIRVSLGPADLVGIAMNLERKMSPGINSAVSKITNL